MILVGIGDLTVAGFLVGAAMGYMNVRGMHW